MADGADPRLHSVHALVRLPGGEHVLPNRVARAGVVEADLAAGVGRLEASQERKRLLGDRLPRPARGRGGVPGEVADCRCRRSRRGRGCRRGRRRSARAPGRRSRPVRRRSPRGRRGTRSRRPEHPRCRRAPPRRRAGCRARRRAGRCAFSAHELPSTVSLDEGWAFAAAAGDPGGGRRRGDGHPFAAAAQRPDRPGRGGRGSVLQPRADRAGGGLSRPSASAGTGGSGRDRRHAGSACLAPPAAAARAARATAGARRRRGGGRHLAPARGRRTAARRVAARARVRRRTLDPGAGVPGSETSPSPPASRPSSPARAGRPQSRWCAASRAAGGSPGSGIVVAFGVVTLWLFAGCDRPALQRLRAAQGGPAALGRARAGAQGGRGGGRGLPRRREPADDRA